MNGTMEGNLKEKAANIIYRLDPTLKLFFHPHAEGSIAYNTKEHKIIINFKKFEEFYFRVSEHVNFSIYEVFEIALIHEFGHSTGADYKKDESLFDKLFNAKNWVKLDAENQMFNKIVWWEKELKEELRAWDEAKKHLKRFDQVKLEVVINYCLKSYRYKVEILKEALTIIQNQSQKKAII